MSHQLIAYGTLGGWFALALPTLFGSPSRLERSSRDVAHGPDRQVTQAGLKPISDGQREKLGAAFGKWESVCLRSCFCSKKGMCIQQLYLFCVQFDFLLCVFALTHFRCFFHTEHPTSSIGTLHPQKRQKSQIPYKTGKLYQVCN